jgi:hypothetical protein
MPLSYLMGDRYFPTEEFGVLPQGPVGYGLIVLFCDRRSHSWLGNQRPHRSPPSDKIKLGHYRCTALLEQNSTRLYHRPINH